MYKTILAPIDVAVPEISEQILEKALFHLTYSKCQLTLLAVASANADENQLDTIRSKLMEFTENHISSHEGRIHLRVNTGLPSDEVLKTSDELKADLVLIGSHRGGSNLLGRSTLGSTAAKIASQSKCDVYIVKPS